MRTVALLVLLAACSKDDAGGTGSAGSAATGSAATGSAAKKGTGFSASLSAELAKEGSAAPSVPLNAAPAPAGSGAIGSGASGSGAMVAMAGSAAATSPTTTPPSTTSPAKGSASAPSPAAGSAAVAATRPATTTTTTTTTAPTPPSPPPSSAARVPVKPPAEIAAIKMDLEPNWVRDVGEAGTISFVLNVPSSSETRVFSFHYGYDPAGAPDDRDAYMKWLADNKLLSVSLNRQRGAAWYLEGSDGNGAPAFRTLVMFGGKHLVCWGTLYKDAASNSLGDLRDKVVMTAKQICGTLAL